MGVIRRLTAVAKKRRDKLKFGRNSGVVGHSKISTLISDFARPINEVLAGRNPDVGTVRRAMSLVIAVWNAHVLAMPLWGQPEVLAETRERLAGPTAPPELRMMFEALTVERLTRFADMPLLVGEWSVRELPDAQFSFSCTGHLPRPRTGPDADPASSAGPRSLSLVESRLGLGRGRKRQS